MNHRITTGTGLALLAGAIALHALMPAVTGGIEPAAEAAWTPVARAMPSAAEPQAPSAAKAPAQAPSDGGAPTVTNIAVVPTPSSGSGVVVFRLWSNGNIDRRMINSTAGLTYQNGWQPLITTP